MTAQKLELKSFTFNPFSENSYLVYNQNKEAILFDPGCYDKNEENSILNFIENNELHVKRLINTHCHIDHILGNSFIAKKFNLKLEANHLENQVLQWAEKSAQMWQVNYTTSPPIEVELNEGDLIIQDDMTFEIVHVPGHSPGSLAFINHQNKFIIGGDVLFNGSIGRTDLPGGNFEELSRSIKSKLYCLPDDYIVYSGHGEPTTIGFEKKNNPFVKM